jgi:hypothetical protein
VIETIIIRGTNKKYCNFTVGNPTHTCKDYIKTDLREGDRETDLHLTGLYQGQTVGFFNKVTNLAVP